MLQLVGGRFNEQTNYIFHNPKAIIIIFNVLSFLDEQGQMDLLDRFIILLEECTVDRAICSAVGLIQKIIDMLRDDELLTKFSFSVKHKLIQLIGILGSYSISVSELKGMYLLKCMYFVTD
jgi:hypothetical protein